MGFFLALTILFATGNTLITPWEARAVKQKKKQATWKSLFRLLKGKLLYSFKRNKLKIPSPGNAKVKNCSLLNGKKLEYKQTDEELIIQIPKELKHEVVTTIEVELDINSKDIQPIDLNN